MSTIQSSTDVMSVNLASDASYKENSSINNSATNSTKNLKAINELENSVKASASTAVTEKNATEESPLTTKQLEKVAQQLQEFVGDLNRSLEFSVDEDSGRDVIKVIDTDSGDILKQFPSEEVLTLVSKLSEMIGGFVDTKA